MPCQCTGCILDSVQTHWCRNLLLCHAASYAIELPLLKPGFTRPNGIILYATSAKEKEVVRATWKLLVSNVVNLMDHNDLQSKTMKEQVRKCITDEFSLFSLCPQNWLRHHWKYSLGLNSCVANEHLWQQCPVCALLKFPADEGSSPWLLSLIFAQGKMTNLVPSLNSLNVISFSSSISYFPYGKQRFLGCVFNCSGAQDIPYPLSNAFHKHSLIQCFTTALCPYNIKTDENFQL